MFTMIFNSKIDIYQAATTFADGEVTSGHSLLSDQPLYCHLKFTGSELQSGDRKQAIHRAKMTYEHSPVTLTARDVIKIDGAFYRLLTGPLSRFGLSNRRFYEVEIIEDFDIEVV
jgi:hypothetical protein